MLKGQKKMLAILIVVLMCVMIVIVILYKKNTKNDAGKSSPISREQDIKKSNETQSIFPDKRYVLGVDHKITWKISKRTGGTHEGVIERAQGFLDYSNSLITGGEIVFNMGSVTNTDIFDKELKTRFIKELKGGDFFSVDKYSTAKIIISSVESVETKENELKLHGQLTIKNITKPIDIILRKKEIDKKISLIGTAHFNRTLYGVDKGSSGILDTLGSVLIEDNVQIAFVLNFK